MAALPLEVLILILKSGTFCTTERLGWTTERIGQGTLLVPLTLYDRPDARDIARFILNAGLINSTWRAAAIDEGLWKTYFLRVSPTPLLRPVGSSASDCICSVLTDPLNTSPIIHAAMPAPFRTLFQRRTLAAWAAEQAYHCDGYCVVGGGMAPPDEMPRFCCTERLATPPAPAAFAYADLSFMIELFEHDSERKRRNETRFDAFLERNPEGDWDEFVEDFVHPEAQRKFASAPHFAFRTENENLVWSATVRGDADSMAVKATVPLEQGTISRRLSLPVDIGGGDRDGDGGEDNWLNPFRVVVTAVRPDGRMCQIIDVRGYQTLPERLRTPLSGDGRAWYGLKSHDGGEPTGWLKCGIVGGDEDDWTGESGLVASINFRCSGEREPDWRHPDGPRRQFGPRLAENTSGRPDAFDRFTEEKEEYSDREPVHPGALYEVSFEWERGGDFGLQPESLDWVAARLNELRWH